MLPEMPVLPILASVDASTLSYGLRTPAKPGMQKVASMTNARAEEAARLANEMRVAYAYTRAQNKASKRRAKAKERAAQRAAERR